tara:strand:+ start:1666 stop:2559 length:894 start_codon:yes stop_codon:yes gene_type:complete
MKYDVKTSILLLDFLQEIYPSSSKRRLRKMLTDGRISIDEIPEFRAKALLEPGQTLKIHPKKSQTQSNLNHQRKKPMKELIFIDESILVVNKPQGLLSVATDRLETNTMHTRCVNFVKEESEKNWAYIVHRLDKPTSGLMVFARNPDDKKYLQNQFANQNVHRTYHAVVQGVPKDNNGMIEQHIREGKNTRMQITTPSHRDAKKAITHWSKITHSSTHSLLEIYIQTGKRHQIRLALNSINHPIIGDQTYNSSPSDTSRLYLHASALEFQHPVTDEPMRFESPHPFTSGVFAGLNKD